MAACPSSAGEAQVLYLDEGRVLSVEERVCAAHPHDGRFFSYYNRYYYCQAAYLDHRTPTCVLTC